MFLIRWHSVSQQTNWERLSVQEELRTWVQLSRQFSWNSADKSCHIEEVCLGYDAVQSVESHPNLWRNMSPPSSESKNKPSKKPAWKKVAYPSTLKIEATYSSETSVDFRRTTRRYIAEDESLHNHNCDNLKSCMPHRSHTCILNSYLWRLLCCVFANVCDDSNVTSFDAGYWIVS
jgi:hypothetical protein